MVGASGTGDGGGGTGGLPPFLLKTYEMIDDTSTDDIVSWSYSKKSFVVWNPPEFSRLLLPSYFKHNNFSSFIRQLNTYGFRKIDPERWEFANEDFVKGQKNLLKNIYRRKPVHSHSHPPGSLVDAERAALDESIDRLSREKAGLQSNILRIKQQKLALKLQYEELSKRIDGMEKRQEDLLNFFDKALQKPAVLEQLLQKIQSMDLSAYNKKRRLPKLDQSLPVPENDFVDVCSNSRPEFGNVFHLNFSDKLRLELSPAISDKNLVSFSKQSSNEDRRSVERIISEEHKVVKTTPETLVLSPESLDPSDAGISFTFNMKSPSSRIPVTQDSARPHSLRPSLSSTGEGDVHLSCHLNLTLASCPSYMDENYLTKLPEAGNQEVRNSSDPKVHGNGKDSGSKLSSSQNLIREVASLSSSKALQHNSQDQAPVRVNDLFWEQFLTERPGDNEEAHSNNKAKNMIRERMEGSVMSFLKI